MFFRVYNVVGIIFGGKLRKREFLGEDILLFRIVKEIVEGVYKKFYNDVIVEKIVKYKYNFKFKIGGIFGGNYLVEGDFVLIFNW